MYHGTYNRLGVHVLASTRDVIRAARRKLKRHALRDPQYRDSRRAFYRAMLEEHAKARALFRKYRF